MQRRVAQTFGEREAAQGQAWGCETQMCLRNGLWFRDKAPRVLRGGKNLKPQEGVKPPRESVLTPGRRTKDWTLEEASSSGVGCRDAIYEL